MTSLDQICKRLGICNPEMQGTCIGYSQRKPTCGIQVAAASRSQAAILLEDIAYDLQNGNPISNSNLENIATLLLCKRYHYVQAEENVQRWNRILRTTPTTQQRPSVPTQSSGSVSVPRAHTPPTPPQRNLQNFSDRELLEEIKKRMTDPFRTELSDGICDIARPLLGHDGIFHGIERRGDHRSGRLGLTDDSNNRTGPSRQASVNRSQSTTAAVVVAQPIAQRLSRNEQTLAGGVGRTQSNSVTRPELDSDTIRQARIAALSNSTTDTTPDTSEDPTTQSRAPSPLRQSHVECVVCLSPFDEDPEERWECGTCLNRVHRECFGQWSTSQSPGRPTRCMFCRTDTEA